MTKNLIKITEHTLVNGLMTELVRFDLADVGIVVKHADTFTSGIPDISVTMNGMTSWWEVKHAKPLIVGTGLQLLTARRLAKHGHCHYVVYLDLPAGQRTLIVRPDQIQPDGSFNALEPACKGFDHHYVATFMWALHHR